MDNMDIKYLSKMFQEFKKAYGIDDSFSNFYKYEDLFEGWVNSKIKAAINYVQLFDYMKINNENIDTIAEFGKGIYDTVTRAMVKRTDYRPIVISPYAETLKQCIGVEAFTGELTLFNDNAIVRYPTQEEFYKNPNCYSSFNDEINTFMTQIPFSKEELKPFLKLLDSNKKLFIGTFGLLSDKDCEDNLKKLKALYQELNNISYRDVNFCNETYNDCYLSAIKIDSKVKTLIHTYTLHG